MAATGRRQSSCRRSSIRRMCSTSTKRFRWHRRSRGWAGAACCSIGARRANVPISMSAGMSRHLLVPLIEQLGQPPALIGYCLGGTMAIGAANLTPVERVVTVAAPWHFSDYPEDSRAALQDLWRSFESCRGIAEGLADGSPASGLLVARPGADGIEIREFRGARHREATKCGGSSCSRIGRTRARPCPSLPRES